MQKIFYPFLCEQGAEFPVVVFVDGHTSHFSFDISEFCTEKKIVLIALYPNATHIIQPMDVAVFGPLKKKWRHAVHNWKFQHNSCKSLTKEHFACLLQQVIVENVKPEYLRSGFRTCGLFPFNPDGVNYKKLMENNPNIDNEDDSVARAEKIERDEFAIAFKRIGEIIGSDRECAFFKFYSSNGEKPWDSTIEDTTAYYIWRDAFQKSRNPEISALIEEIDENEDQIDDIVELQSNLISEEISNWEDDPNVNYFEGFGDEVELEFVDESNVWGGNVDGNRLIQVLDDTIIVPAHKGSLSSKVASKSETEPLRTAAAELPPTETTVLIKSPIDASKEQNTLQTEPQASTSTQSTESSVSIDDLYNLPTTDECPVNEVFLKCLRPEMTASKVEKTEQKFRVPKITGKISLHFSSALESHYISCINFTSGTSVVSSKWHRDYIRKYKEKHDSAVERRLQRKMKKNSRATTPARKNEMPKRSTRPRKPKLNPVNTPSSGEFEWTDSGEDFDPEKGRKKKKNTGNSRKSPLTTANVLDTTSFSSESSFSPPPKKKIRKFKYNTDES